jgi:hypothetical protein
LSAAVIVGNQVYSYTDQTLYLTPNTSVSSSSLGMTGVEYAAFTTYLNDANSFMSNQSAMWSALGANGIGVADGVLVNIRPGITVTNTGTITVEGDPTTLVNGGANPDTILNVKGIDLSGSAYSGSVLYHPNDTQILDGHFGQYDEPVVLTIRAGGNLNFGSYNDDSANLGNYASLSSYLQTNLHLGTLSDGFSQYTDGLSGNVALGAGASAWAAPFDPAAVGAYNNLSGGLGADSATYFLTAGADLSAADPLAVNNSAAQGTLTVAGVTGEATTPTIQGSANVGFVFPVTTDPLYLYNFSWSNGNRTPNGATTSHLPTDWLGGTSVFADYASLVRTGTGNISIATAQDLNLQSPLSVIYTAGTGYNVNGGYDSTTGINQPLAGFTQYSGIMKLVGSGSTNSVDYLEPSTFPTNGGAVSLAIGGSIIGDMNPNGPVVGDGIMHDQEELPYDMTALGSQLKLENWITQHTDQSELIGSFNDIYATNSWMTSDETAGDTFYTQKIGTSTISSSSAATPGDYQLAWYTWFPYLENTIGSFGGGNISVKAGGSISNVQFVSPTNARDAGTYLVSHAYMADPSDPLGYSGLYVQGGGNLSVTAGGDITDIDTYVQNGTTTLQTGGSVITPILATANGDISVEARETIDIEDKTVYPDDGIASGAQGGFAYTLSGISLIQNADILGDLEPYQGTSTSTKDLAVYLNDTILTGILTAAPTGAVTLNAVGNVTLNVSDRYLPDGTKSQPTTTGGAFWNTTQGILPAQIRLISLGGDIINGALDSTGASTGGTFITYPDPQGTVDLLAEGSVELDPALFCPMPIRASCRPSRTSRRCLSPIGRSSPRLTIRRPEPPWPRAMTGYSSPCPPTPRSISAAQTISRDRIRASRTLPPTPRKGRLSSPILPCSKATRRGS